MPTMISTLAIFSQEEGLLRQEFNNKTTLVSFLSVLSLNLQDNLALLELITSYNLEENRSVKLLDFHQLFKTLIIKELPVIYIKNCS